MRVAFAIVIPLLAALLQGSLAPSLALGVARPSLTLLAAGSWSVATGAREAVWWAFIGGIATDLLSGGPLGAYAAASLPCVAAIGLGERSLARPLPVALGAALVGLATAGTALAYVAILALAGQPLPALPLLVASTVGGALYTAVLAVVMYPLARVARRLTERQVSLGW